jgi:hypothetical protein
MQMKANRFTIQIKATSVGRTAGFAVRNHRHPDWRHRATRTVAYSQLEE